MRSPGRMRSRSASGDSSKRPHHEVPAHWPCFCLAVLCEALIAVLPEHWSWLPTWLLANVKAPTLFVSCAFPPNTSPALHGDGIPPMLKGAAAALVSSWRLPFDVDAQM